MRLEFVWAICEQSFCIKTHVQVTMVYVLDEVGQPLNSGFLLPGEFLPTSIHYHPSTTATFLVGNGVSK